MQIYIYRDNLQAGPFSEAEIRAQLSAGTITRETLVWWDGQADWKPLGQTQLGSPAVQTATREIPRVPAPPPGVAPMPGALPPVSSTPRVSVLAIVSLVCGILALPGIVCLPVLIIFGLAAVITGHIAYIQIGRNPSQSGKGIALAGLIVGYIDLALVAVLLIFLIALGNQVKDVFKTISAQLQSAEAMTNSAPANPDSTNNAPSNPDSTNNAPTPPDTNNAPVTPDNK